ncbi:MAG TPA: Uma2 family endonuclease [Thermoanaerobaculia bacterium]|nr:Uma2 family endonuclease [Thermoanaerobaculia bacterium]
MSQPAVAALAPLPFELVYSDGEPLETEWHVWELYLLLESFQQAMAEQGRTDFYVGGNMFVYYSQEQAREVWEEETGQLSKEPAFRGPDVFWVGGVSPHQRKAWVSWDEDWRLPDVIVELLSPKTAENDRTKKKELYQNVFHTAEYFLYDPDAEALEGFRLMSSSYQPIPPNREGRLWSEQLGVSFGFWQGVFNNKTYLWLRLFRPDGNMVLTEAETERQRADAARQQADAARQQADAERQRANEAEAELTRLRALLAETSSPESS